jgi:hypothetical protein
MEVLGDDFLGVVFAFLPTRCLARSAQACTTYKLVAREDQLWLPLFRQRWRFGSETADGKVPSISGRESAIDLAFAHTCKEMSSSMSVFTRYLKRCQQDLQVLVLTLQLHNAPFSETCTNQQLHPGAVVRVRNLTSNKQYNGCYAVISSMLCSQPVRFTIQLVPSMQSLYVADRNIEFVCPAMNSQDIEHRALAIGIDAIDALLRLSESAIGIPRLAATAKMLLGHAMDRVTLQ